MDNLIKNLQTESLQWQPKGSSSFYRMINLSSLSLQPYTKANILLAACAKNGGPVAIFKKDYTIEIYNSKGRFMSDFPVFLVWIII